MMANLRRAWLFLILFFLAGCATGPTYNEASKHIGELKEGRGRIYIYRESRWSGIAIQPKIKINQLEVGTSIPGGFFYVDLPGGQYTITSKKWFLKMYLQPGQHKYVEMIPIANSAGYGLFNITLRLVDSDYGHDMIQKMKYTGGKEADQKPQF